MKKIIRNLTITIMLFVSTSLGAAQAQMNPHVSTDEANLVFLDEAGSQDVFPLLKPSEVSCNNYWEAISTGNGSPAFVTLNVNSQAYSTNSAEWRPAIQQAGLYRVEAYIPAPPSSVTCSKLNVASQNTTQAKYKVYHSGGVSDVTLNQSNNPNSWVVLGTFQFTTGDTGYVTLSDFNSENNLTRFVVFSALRFIPQGRVYSIYLPKVSREIPPVNQTSSVVIRQRQAFDTCIRPTLSGMQTWWNSSPYYIYNIYMGGVSNTSCHPETLTADWISAVNAQGWEFIPTWVGPQAPCTTFKYRFSYDPQNAFGEGVLEANQAFNRAQSLGLVGSEVPKTVIYYDMEAFYGGSAECRAATKSFLSGWSQRLHELGARSGVYGSSCYYMPDWKQLSNPLDDAWLASWYKVDHDNDDSTDKVYFYDPYASVWSVLCSASLSDAWTNHQRIRQYAGGHNETWGGVKLNIDSNITDGHVFSPGGASSADTNQVLPSVEVSASSDQTISQFQLVAPESGWVFQDGRLLWTGDNGTTWIDRTPNLENIEFIGFHFKDTQTGWSLVRTGDVNSGLSVLVLRTTDGGVTWFASALPVSPEMAFQSEGAFFDFIDGSTGWLSLRLQASSAFRPGLLFLTRDGGDTWQDFSIPVGEPVNFITSQVGWTAGGPAGDELYMTRDGGFTWESAAFINDGPGIVQYNLPEFNDPLNGTLLVTIYEGEDSRLEQYITQDGGLSWNLVGLVSLGPQLQPGEPVPADVTAEQELVAADSSAGFLYTSEDAASQPLSLASARSPDGVVEITFASPMDGWLKAVQSSCSGSKGDQQSVDFTCSFHESIWKTSDGGATWQEIR